MPRSRPAALPSTAVQACFPYTHALRLVTTTPVTESIVRADMGPPGRAACEVRLPGCTILFHTPLYPWRCFRNRHGHTTREAFGIAQMCQEMAASSAKISWGPRLAGILAGGSGACGDAASSDYRFQHAMLRPKPTAGNVDQCMLAPAVLRGFPLETPWLHLAALPKEACDCAGSRELHT